MRAEAVRGCSGCAPRRARVSVDAVPATCLPRSPGCPLRTGPAVPALVAAALNALWRVSVGGPRRVLRRVRTHMRAPPPHALQLGEAAVAAGVRAYAAVEAELRTRMPLSMRDIVAAHRWQTRSALQCVRCRERSRAARSRALRLTHAPAPSTAAQQARDVFERHLEDNISALKVRARCARPCPHTPRRSSCPARPRRTQSPANPQSPLERPRATLACPPRRGAPLQTRTSADMRCYKRERDTNKHAPPETRTSPNICLQPPSAPPPAAAASAFDFLQDTPAPPPAEPSAFDFLQVRILSLLLYYAHVACSDY